MKKVSEQALRHHQKFLEKVGYTRLKAKHKKNPYKVPFPNLKVDEVLPLSNGFANAGFVNTAMSNRFKEKDSVRQEIERKANSLAPLFNKGPLQPVTSVSDAKNIGRK